MNTLAMREFVIDSLKKEVVGPDPGFPETQSNGEEIILEAPRARYGAGVLFPKKSCQVEQSIGSANDGSNVSLESPEDAQGEEKTAAVQTKKPLKAEATDEIDQEVGLTNEYLPSAMGLSALINVPEVLTVKISTARYTRGNLTVPDYSYAKKDKNGIKYCEFPKQDTNKQVAAWYRKPIEKTIEISQSELLTAKIADFRKHVFFVDEHSQTHQLPLELHVVTRPVDNEKSPALRLVTMTLVNLQVALDNSPKDEECFFQTSFSVSAGEHSCFIPYPDQTFDENDQESRSLFLLYRHRNVFAVGHGCAANWVPKDSQSAYSIQTDVLPTYDIKPVSPRKIKDINLSMRQLAFGTDEHVFQTCKQLIDAYSTWIEGEEKKVEKDSTLTKALKDTASVHLSRCKKCLGRMKEGVEILRSQPLAMRAFRLMNESMFMQREHYILSSKEKRVWKPTESGKVQLERAYVEPTYLERESVWYPFQLGFVLMNIKGIVIPSDADRDLVDLIWFPTGGGKTEAYLGLTAFVLFFRRLRGDKSGSTAVLMRYTLRLLTTQQFQRAASLICACEVLRKKDEGAFGKAPFSIGLWVGDKVTPNSGAAAVKAIDALIKTGGENKFIITSCPWCGCQLGPISGKKVKGYITPTKTKMLFRCEDKDCYFSRPGQHLPICVVDEDLYEEPPSLLIGTVDKFAMLPWDPRAGVLFGVSTTKTLTPPDLIIQDELHLISGPLGSMVGLYEPLIDLLSTRENIRPKIIASTATISRADEQVKALYGRESVLFPPQALVAGESFFAFEDTEANGRTYVGVFGSAYQSHATSQVRTMSSLLQSVKMTNAAPEVIDPYWTLIGYFNSLRELGHAISLVDGDISEYIKVIAARKGISWRNYKNTPPPIRKFWNEPEELTSRVDSTELPEKLNRLFIAYNGTDRCNAVDVCFATNMIQVGLDVSRLSLMTVVGQPKTTSEYIQASSRVGRDPSRPGLVVINYSPSKPRDRSHYERFKQYHQSIYRAVEPTSVTPFAVPVRERALHALIIGLVRMWGSPAVKAQPTAFPDDALIKRITKSILDRVAASEPDETAGTSDMIGRIFERWRTLPAGTWGSMNPSMDQEPTPLMYAPGARTYFSWLNTAYETPTSMRAVDKNCEAMVLSDVYPTP